jgi:hypothetical protein
VTEPNEIHGLIDKLLADDEPSETTYLHFNLPPATSLTADPPGMIVRDGATVAAGKWVWTVPATETGTALMHGVHTSTKRNFVDTDNLWPAFQAKAASQGTNPSALIRQWIRDYLAEDDTSDAMP